METERRMRHTHTQRREIQRDRAKTEGEDGERD